MLLMMNQMFGKLGGDTGGEGGLPFSSDDLAKATGLPAFITDKFMGKQRSPPTPAEEKADRMWNIIHTLFALLAGAYVVFVVGRSIDTFGVNSPAPATFQNPFLVFIMGELLIQGFKTVGASQGAKKGPWLWLQVLKDLARDGCIVVFVMGAASWWKGQS
jgi:GET complex subunit GET2